MNKQGLIEFLRKLYLSKKLEFVLDALAIVIVSLATFVFLRNIDFIPVPNSDIFQFIRDGRYYTNFLLTPNIHAPPANPLLISLLSGFLLSYDYPEILAAKIINIFSVSLSLLLIYSVSRRYLNAYLSILVLLFSTFYPLTFFIAVGIDSEALFTLVVLLSLSFFSFLDKKNTAYAVAGLSFLIRNEGALLFLSFVTVDLLRFYKLPDKKKIIFPSLKKNLGVIFGFSIIFFWVVISYLNNYKTSIQCGDESLAYGSYFIYEIFDRMKDIPNFAFFANFPKFIFSFSYLYYNNIFLGENTDVLMGLVLLIIFAYFSLKYKNWFFMTSSLFIFLHLLLHSFFPAYSHRYFFPVIYLGCLICFWLINKLFLSLNRPVEKALLVLMIFLFCVFSFYDLLVVNKKDNYLSGIRYYASDYRKSGEWIQDQLEFSDKDVDVFSFQPWQVYPFTDLHSIKNPQSHQTKPDMSKKCDTSAIFDYEKKSSQEKFVDGDGIRQLTPNSQSAIKVEFFDLGAIEYIGCLNLECFSEEYLSSENDIYVISTHLDYERVEKITNHHCLDLVYSDINESKPTRLEIFSFSKARCSL